MEPEEHADMFAEPELRGRVTALETSLRELGTLFVQYQQDVAAILVSECVRMTQQLQETKHKFEGTVHTLVQESLAGIKGQMTQEILETLVSAKHREDPAAGETVSTVTSANTDVYAELIRLMRETRTTVLSLQSDLNVHRNLTEGRIGAVETRLELQERKADINSRVVPPSKEPTILTAGSTSKLSESLTSSGQQLPRHSAEEIPDMSHLERQLERLGSAVKPAWPAEQIAFTGTAAQPVAPKAWPAEPSAASGAAAQQPVQPKVLFWPANVIATQGTRTSSRQRAANASASPRLPDSIPHGKQAGSSSEVSPRGRQPGSPLDNGMRGASGLPAQPAQPNSVLFWPGASDPSVRSPSLQLNPAMTRSHSRLLESSPQGHSPGNPGSLSAPVAHPMITPRGSLSAPVAAQQAQPKVLFWPAKANVGNGTPVTSNPPPGQVMGTLRTISPQGKHRGSLSERSPPGSRPGSLSENTPRGARPGALHVRVPEGTRAQPGSLSGSPWRARQEGLPEGPGSLHAPVSNQGSRLEGSPLGSRPGGLSEAQQGIRPGSIRIIPAGLSITVPPYEN